MEPSEKDRLIQQLKEATQQVRYWKQIAKKTGKIHLRESENLSYIIQTLKQTKTQLLDEIAERKWTEEKNERLGHILDESLNEIYIFDAKTFRFLQVNRGARHNLGYSIEEITTLTPLDLKPEFTPETFAELIQPLHNGEKNKVRFETIHRRKDGSLYPVEVHLQLVAGSTPVFVAIIIDITDRKQAVKALLKSEERYRSFFKNNHSIMLLVDPENADIVDANPAAISYYGWSHEDLTGKKITDINILTKEKVFQEMERAEKEQQHFYFRHRLSNGEIRDVEVYSSPITIYNENFLFSIIYDITDRKLAQSALIESEKELKIKAKDLEELNAALKVLLNKRQEDKEELEEGILSNVRTLIEPYIVKLKRSKLPQSQKTLLNILESNLNEIVSPFTRKLSSKYLNLTPTQIQVANLVKHGKTNKEISEILHVAGRTIAFHRENIRKKFDLTNKKTNLKTYLMSIN